MKENQLFSKYLREYSKEENLVGKCLITHRAIHDAPTAKERIELLLLIAKHFNDPSFHSSEIKTVLVIAKPMKQNPILKDAVNSLWETHQKLRK